MHITKINRVTIFALITILSFALIGQLFIKPVYAANALYIDPASVTVPIDSQVTLAVKGSGTNFNASQINISYDSTKLQYVSYSLAGSVMSNDTAFSQSAGNISVAVFNVAGQSGNGLLLASFTFKATAGSGSSNVSLATGSVLLSAGTVVATAGAISTITQTTPTKPPVVTPVTTPTQKPSATPTPTQKQSPSPTPTPSPTPPPTIVASSSDKTPPQIKTIVPFGFVSSNIGFKIVTNESTKAVVRYGDKKDKLALIARSTGFSDNYNVSFAEYSQTFGVGKKIYYTVDVTDSAGNTTTSPIEELNIESVGLTITIKDADGNIIKDSVVLINGKEYKTDGKGNVKVKDVLPGNVTVSLKKGSEIVYLADLTAVAGVNDQAFVVQPGKVAGATKNKNISALGAGTIIAPLVLLIVGLFIIYRIKDSRQKQNNLRLHTPNPWGDNQTTPINPSTPSEVITPDSLDQKSQEPTLKFDVNNSQNVNSTTVSEPTSSNVAEQPQDLNKPTVIQPQVTSEPVKSDNSAPEQEKTEQNN